MIRFQSRSAHTNNCPRLVLYLLFKIRVVVVVEKTKKSSLFLFYRCSHTLTLTLSQTETNTKFRKTSLSNKIYFLRIRQTGKSLRLVWYIYIYVFCRLIFTFSLVWKLFCSHCFRWVAKNAALLCVWSMKQNVKSMRVCVFKVQTDTGFTSKLSERWTVTESEMYRRRAWQARDRDERVVDSPFWMLLAVAHAHATCHVRFDVESKNEFVVVWCYILIFFRIR